MTCEFDGRRVLFTCHILVCVFSVFRCLVNNNAFKCYAVFSCQLELCVVHNGRFCNLITIHISLSDCDYGQFILHDDNAVCILCILRSRSYCTITANCECDRFFINGIAIRRCDFLQSVSDSCSSCSLMRQTFDSLSFTLFGCPLDTDNGVCRLAVFIKLICKLYAKLCAQCYIVICCLSALVINNTADPCCPVNVIAQNLENCAFKLCFACSVNLADGYAVCCVVYNDSCIIIYFIAVVFINFITICIDFLSIYNLAIFINAKCECSYQLDVTRSFCCFFKYISIVLWKIANFKCIFCGCPLNTNYLCIFCIGFLDFSCSISSYICPVNILVCQLQYCACKLFLCSHINLADENTCVRLFSITDCDCCRIFFISFCKCVTCCSLICCQIICHRGYNTILNCEAQIRYENCIGLFVFSNKCCIVFICACFGQSICSVRKSCDNLVFFTRFPLDTICYFSKSCLVKLCPVCVF